MNTRSVWTEPMEPPQEKHMKRLVALMMLSLFSVAVLAGCNTVAGAGKDVQKAGEKVEDAAKGK